MKVVIAIALTAAFLAPTFADEVIIGEMDEDCALPFCGG